MAPAEIFENMKFFTDVNFTHHQQQKGDVQDPWGGIDLVKHLQQDLVRRRMPERAKSMVNKGLLAASLGKGKEEGESVALAVFRAEVMLFLEDGGAKDLHNHENWRVRDIWVGRSGRIYFQSKKDNRATSLFDGTGVGTLEVLRMRPGYSCWPEAFTVGPPRTGAIGRPGAEERPLIFGGADDGTVDDFLKAVGLFGNRVPQPGGATESTHSPRLGEKHNKRTPSKPRPGEPGREDSSTKQERPPTSLFRAASFAAQAAGGAGGPGGPKTRGPHGGKGPGSPREAAGSAE